MSKSDPSAIFDDLAYRKWDLGPRLTPIPTQPPDLADAFVQVLEAGNALVDQFKLKNPRMIDVYVDFLCNAQVNAVADIEGDLAFVGVTQGAVLLPRDMFQRMLSHPLVLIRGGEMDTGVAKEHPQFTEGLPRDIVKLHDSRRKEGRNEQAAFTTHPVRREIAKMLTRFALTFLITHELAHLAYGHVGYLKSKRGAAFYVEGSKTSLPNDDEALTRQGMELDADSTGTASSLLSALTMTHNGYLPEAFDVIFGRTDQRLFNWAFAITALCCLWGLSVDATQFSGHSHPPIGARLFLIFIRARTIVDARFPELSANFDRTILTATTEAQKAILLVGGQVSDFDAEALQAGLKDPRTFQQMLEIVTHYHEKITPELKAYEYIDPTFRDGAHSN